MPPDDDTHNCVGRSSASTNSVPLTTTAQSATQPKRSIFSLPAPVKRVFDKFPLREYEKEELPERARRVVEGRGEGRRGGGGHVLHVFASEEDARLGRPSWNPGCLKWQTYLLFNAVDFTLIPSNNHASPSGSLPFLLPGTPTTGGSTPDPIPAHKLPKWLAKQQKTLQTPETNDPRLESYQSLLDTRIRKAWLYQLYLTPQNDPLMQKLYVTPCSSNPLVQYTLTRHLRSAASAELVKSSSSSTNFVDAEVLLREAEEAFEALSELLGEEDEWFWGGEGPGVFDAGVFAYTQLLLDEGELGWRFNPVGEGVRRWGNLVRHRERVLRGWFGGGDGLGGDGAVAEEVGQGEEVGGENGRPGLHARTTSTLGKRKTLRG